MNIREKPANSVIVLRFIYKKNRPIRISEIRDATKFSDNYTRNLLNQLTGRQMIKKETIDGVYHYSVPNHHKDYIKRFLKRCFPEEDSEDEQSD